jgi:hypothetical protein
LLGYKGILVDKVYDIVKKQLHLLMELQSNQVDAPSNLSDTMIELIGMVVNMGSGSFLLFSHFST